MSVSSTPRLAGRRGVVAIFVGLLFIAGNMSNAIYPMFVNALANIPQMANINVGNLATVEFLAYGVVVLFAGKWLPEQNLRLIAALCLILQLVTGYLTTLVSPLVLIFCRLLYGAASGILVWIAFSYAARSLRPGKLISTYTACLMTCGVLWSLLSPYVIVPLFGYSAVFLTLTILSLVALVLIRYCPNEFEEICPEDTSASITFKAQLPPLITLISVGFFAAFMAIFWVYSDPIAQRLTGKLVEHWLTVSLICQIAGAALSVVLVERLAYGPVLTVGLGLLAMQMVAMIIGVDGTAFVVWTGIYGFLGYFLVGFFVRAIAQMDPTSKIVTYFPAAQLLSASFGPMLVSNLVSETDLNSILTINLAVIVACPVLLWLSFIIYRCLHTATAVETPV